MKIVIMKKSTSSTNRLKRLSERRPGASLAYSGKLEALKKRRGGETPDKKLEYFRKLILDHLDTLEGDDVITKGGKALPVGTVRDWKGKRYVKTAPGKWRTKYDGETRGAKMAVSAIKRKIAEATDAQTMLQIVLENRDRFSDAQGNPLPFIMELSKYVAEQGKDLEKKQTAKDQGKMGNLNGTEEEKAKKKWKSNYTGGTREQRLNRVKDDYTTGKIDFDTAVKEYRAIYPKLSKENAEKTVQVQFDPPKEKDEKADKKRPAVKIPDGGTITDYTLSPKDDSPRVKQNEGGNFGITTNGKDWVGMGGPMAGPDFYKTKEEAESALKDYLTWRSERAKKAEKEKEKQEKKDVARRKKDAEIEANNRKWIEEAIRNGGTVKEIKGQGTVLEDPKTGSILNLRGRNQELYEEYLKNTFKEKTPLYQAGDYKVKQRGENDFVVTGKDGNTIPQKVKEMEGKDKNIFDDGDNKKDDNPEPGNDNDNSAAFKAIQEKYRSAKAVSGEEEEIAVGKEIVSGRWWLVEADTPTASHNERTFNKTKGFPTTQDGSTINDRDYEKDRAAQEIVIDIGMDYDMRALSFDSPVVVTKDGIVISGNNRTMSSKIAARQGTDTKYIEALKKKAQKFGFTPSDVSKFKNPRVIFEINKHDGYSTALFAKFNSDDKKAMNPIEEAVKVSKIIKQETVVAIAKKISNFETLGKLYADKEAPRKIFDTLVAAGIVEKNQLPKYYTEQTGITGDGKNFIETALLGSILNENNIRGLNREGCKSIRQKLVRALTPLVENKGYGWV